MKFDNIIIGGGISGLTCGIKLAIDGKQVAIVTGGQSSLNLASGSFDLLGYDEQDNIVTNPCAAMAQLGEGHPYRKMDAAAVETYLSGAKRVLSEIGLKTTGSADANHFRLTPVGKLVPTWLTLDEYAMSQEADRLPWKDVTLVTVPGFMDFPTDIFVNNIKKLGTTCHVADIDIEALSLRRKSPSEMRAINLAKVICQEGLADQLAAQINQVAADESEAVLLPAIIGSCGVECIETLKAKCKKQVFLVPTMPPSVCGVRLQKMLRKYFTACGGVFLTGQQVTGGTIEDGVLKNITTTALADDKVEADSFILATGSFSSGGLVSNYKKVSEPIFDLDVDASDVRPNWTAASTYDAQPYMTYGVRTNETFNVFKNGNMIKNLYAVGSVLSGHNSIKRADSDGVRILTGLAVADNIINK